MCMPVQVFPYAEPKTRMLTDPEAASSELFCVDLQVEDTLQCMWSADPNSFDTMEAYYGLVCQKVKSINEGRAKDPEYNWEVDDYYTAVNGLDHPRLGKKPRHVAIVAYADGVDHVQAIGAFAGKKKVVASLVEILLWPPSERVKRRNLVLVNVCFEKVAKHVGYNQLWGGDEANPTCSSLGGSCRRFEAGIEFSKPDGTQSIYTGDCTATLMVLLHIAHELLHVIAWLCFAHVLPVA